MGNLNLIDGDLHIQVDLASDDAATKIADGYKQIKAQAHAAGLQEGQAGVEGVKADLATLTEGIASVVVAARKAKQADLDAAAELDALKALRPQDLLAAWEAEDRSGGEKPSGAPADPAEEKKENKFD